VISVVTQSDSFKYCTDIRVQIYMVDSIPKKEYDCNTRHHSMMVTARTLNFQNTLSWRYPFISYSIFKRESSYCFQRILAIAILSVRLSHGWISQKRCKLESQNLHRRLPRRLLVSGTVELFHKFKEGYHERGR